MLTEDQINTLVDHLNCRLMSVEADNCGFCEVAISIQTEEEGEYHDEMQAYCVYCPLEVDRIKKDCVTIRRQNLRSGIDGSAIENYTEATDESIEEHVGWLMDQANEHWKLNLCWKNTIEGRRVFNNERINKL